MDKLPISKVSPDASKHTSPARRRDRHGRGARGVTILPTLPAWKTRREQFYRMVSGILHEFRQRVPEVASIEFAIEDVPPSDPAEWEKHDVTLSRLFPRDRKRRLADRIVVYRLPIAGRTTPEEMPEFVATLLAHRICQVLLVEPRDLLGDDAGRF